MQGMVYVLPPALDRPEKVAAWIGRGLAFARSLPPKTREGSAVARGSKRTASKKKR
jgi:hypothetical protein